MAENTLYDALIVGGGPAGLSIALGLSRLNRRKVVFTKPQGAGFRNEGAHEIHNILTRDCTPPAEFRKIAREQIEKYRTTEFVEAEIVSVKKLESNDGFSSFEAVDSEGRKWRYKENWPQNIYQCLFCDGYERTHLPAGVLGLSPVHAHGAQMMSLLVTESSGPPTVFTNGPIPDTEPMQKALGVVKALGCKVETAKVTELVPAKAPEVGVTVVLEDGRQFKMGYLHDKPPVVLAGKELIKSLGLSIDAHPVMGEHVKGVEMMGNTSVPGVFVAGDAGTPIKVAANAMSSGATVAAGIIGQLTGEDVQRRLASTSK
ncbi:Thioredoxin reductase verT [Exophiala dermatitidis]